MYEIHAKSECFVHFLAMKQQEQILESLLCFQQGRSESTHQ